MKIALEPCRNAHCWCTCPLLFAEGSRQVRIPHVKPSAKWVPIMLHVNNALQYRGEATTVESGLVRSSLLGMGYNEVSLDPRQSARPSLQANFPFSLFVLLPLPPPHTAFNPLAVLQRSSSFRNIFIFSQPTGLHNMFKFRNNNSQTSTYLLQFLAKVL